MTDMVTPTKNTPREGTHNVGHDLHKMGEHAVQVKDGLLAMGGDLADTARDGASAARQSVAHGVASAKEAISHNAEVAKKDGADAIASLTKKVTENPLTSIGIAVGLGVLIGMVVGRARN